MKRPSLPKAEPAKQAVFAKVGRLLDEARELLASVRVAAELEVARPAALSATRRQLVTPQHQAESAPGKALPKPGKAQQRAEPAASVRAAIVPPRVPPKNALAKAAVVVPPGVEVVTLPSGRDMRYTVEPGSHGAGFMAEWRAKRGGAIS